jgi:hypothetical protein
VLIGREPAAAEGQQHHERGTAEAPVAGTAGIVFCTVHIGFALIVHTAANFAKKVRIEACEDWATRSGQATLTFRLRAINVPLRKASKGHSRLLGTAKLSQNQAHTREFKQFPS